MHEAAKLQFERIATEYASWRGVPENERSPAPAWWWGAAMDALDKSEVMSTELCTRLDLAAGSSYGAAAGLLTTALAEQTSPGWPDEFPKKFRQPDPAEKIA